MGIGGSIVLIAIGAILAFGLEVSIGWLDLRVVGWVLMVVGVIGLIVAVYFWRSRPRELLTRVPAKDLDEVEADERGKEQRPEI